MNLSFNSTKLYLLWSRTQHIYQDTTKGLCTLLTICMCEMSHHNIVVDGNYMLCGSSKDILLGRLHYLNVVIHLLNMDGYSWLKEGNIHCNAENTIQWSGAINNQIIIWENVIDCQLVKLMDTICSDGHKHHGCQTLLPSIAYWLPMFPTYPYISAIVEITDTLLQVK